MIAPAPRSVGGGSFFGRPRRRAAFTLLEVLVVIALIGLLSGVLIMGTTRLLRDRPVTAEEIFWKITDTTRRTALLGNHDVRLSYDAKNHVFVAGDDAQAQRFPFAPQNEVAFDFLAPKSAPGSTTAMLVGGQLVETQTLPFVTFYGDGTCSPFRVQLKGKDTQRILEIDPWTCAPVLEAKTDS